MGIFAIGLTITYRQIRRGLKYFLESDLPAGHDESPVERAAGFRLAGLDLDLPGGIL